MYQWFVVVLVVVLLVTVMIARGSVKDARTRQFIDAAVCLLLGAFILLDYVLGKGEIWKLVLGLISLAGGVFYLVRPRPKRT